MVIYKLLLAILRIFILLILARFGPYWFKGDSLKIAIYISVILLTFFFGGRYNIDLNRVVIGSIYLLGNWGSIIDQTDKVHILGLNWVLVAIFEPFLSIYLWTFFFTSLIRVHLRELIDYLFPS